MRLLAEVERDEARAALTTLIRLVWEMREAHAAVGEKPNDKNVQRMITAESAVDRWLAEHDGKEEKNES